MNLRSAKDAVSTVFYTEHLLFSLLTKIDRGIPFSHMICHCDIKSYLINECKYLFIWIPHNLYVDFLTFQVKKLLIFRETSDDLFLAHQFKK